MGEGFDEIIVSVPVKPATSPERSRRPPLPHERWRGLHPRHRAADWRPAGWPL